MGYKLESTATEQDKQDDKEVFPMLMEDEHNGAIFLITHRDEVTLSFVGTRLACGPVGVHSKDWVSRLTPYYGTVTLTGKQS